jgi:hypothetical protein
LPEADRAALITAWLKDQLPDALRRYVSIQPADSDALPAVEDGKISGFSDDLRERLEFFGLLSINNPAIRKSC